MDEHLLTLPTPYLYEIQFSIQKELKRRAILGRKVKLVAALKDEGVFWSWHIGYTFQDEKGRLLYYQGTLPISDKIGEWYMLSGRIKDQLIEHVLDIQKLRVTPFTSKPVVALSGPLRQ